MGEMKGRYALVTGAAGGIGQAIVKTLQEQGAIVAGCDLAASKADVSLQGDLTDGPFCVLGHKGGCGGSTHFGAISVHFEY